MKERLKGKDVGRMEEDRWMERKRERVLGRL